MARKKRINYFDVRKGLCRPWCDFGLDTSEYQCDPATYIRTLKRETGLADWKIAHDLGVDSGVEVAATTVRLWRVKGEKNG